MLPPQSTEDSHCFQEIKKDKPWGSMVRLHEGQGLEKDRISTTSQLSLLFLC